MKIFIVACGKIENSAYENLWQEYKKRLKWQVKLIEINLKNSSSLSVEEYRNQEKKLILQYLPKDATIIVLDINGKDWSSDYFASKIEYFQQSSIGEVVFLIGGAFGLDKDLCERANYRFSFGRITLPHLMARIVLIEQIYRAQTIIEKHPYHK